VDAIITHTHPMSGKRDTQLVQLEQVVEASSRMPGVVMKVGAETEAGEVTVAGVDTLEDNPRIPRRMGVEAGSGRDWVLEQALGTCLDEKTITITVGQEVVNVILLCNHSTMEGPQRRIIELLHRHPQSTQGPRRKLQLDTVTLEDEVNKTPNQL